MWTTLPTVVVVVAVAVVVVVGGGSGVIADDDIIIIIIVAAAKDGGSVTRRGSISIPSRGGRGEGTEDDVDVDFGLHLLPLLLNKMISMDDMVRNNNSYYSLEGCSDVSLSLSRYTILYCVEEEELSMMMLL